MDTGEGFNAEREFEAGESVVKDVNKEGETQQTAKPSSKEEGWTKSEEEKRLEKLLFGDKQGLFENLAKSAGVASEEVSSTTTRKAPKRKPAWHDDDDSKIQVGEIKRETKFTGSLDYLNKEKTYKEYLTTQFSRVASAPKWADLDREQEVDSDEEILQTVGFLGQSTSTSLPSNNLQHKKLKDLNRATYAEGSVTSVEFHPTSTVAMVAGKSGVASIYSIDGLRNDKLHNMRFNKFTINCARLFDGGCKAVFGGPHSFYYKYDLMVAKESVLYMPRKIVKTFDKFEVSPCGKFLAVAGRCGEIHLISLNSNELLHTFKQENLCTALKFSHDSKKIFAHGNGAEVTIFDLRKERAEHIFLDDGCIVGQALAISPNSSMLATGSKEGVVNVYNYNDVFQSPTPKPQKIVYNLTTAISDVKFNHSSELLSMCSKQVPGAVKLLHFPTGTVFSNFPGFQNKLGRIGSVEFSPMSGFMALASNTKEVSLYRLKHFKNY